MRVIKYRVWDTFNKKWLNPAHLSIGADDGLVRRKDNAGIISGVEIVEFTGLLDRNGAEIYEGDILKNLYRGHECTCGEFQQKPDKNNYVVEYILKRYGSGGKFEATSIELDERGTPDNWLDAACWDRSTEVTSNIHENPELLK